MWVWGCSSHGAVTWHARRRQHTGWRLRPARHALLPPCYGRLYRQVGAAPPAPVPHVHKSPLLVAILLVHLLRLHDHRSLQEGHDLRAPGAARTKPLVALEDLRWDLSPLVLGVPAGPGFQEGVHHVLPPGAHGQVEGGAAAHLATLVHRRPQPQQALHHLQIPVGTRPVQGGFSALIRGVHLRPLADELFHQSGVPLVPCRPAERLVEPRAGVATAGGVMLWGPSVHQPAAVVDKEPIFKPGPNMLPEQLCGPGLPHNLQQVLQVRSVDRCSHLTC
mmetsp:Transcript_58471/g.156281  ORF Transcript_58471/g.156281 Transcript_58471/m.156281 type:complete len:277 (+) Transcript_58471:92-922(+)